MLVHIRNQLVGAIADTPDGIDILLLFHRLALLGRFPSHHVAGG